MAVAEGRLQIRPYTDRDGNKRTAAEVVADNIYFGDSRRDGEGGGYGGQPALGQCAHQQQRPAAGQQHTARRQKQRLPLRRGEVGGEFPPLPGQLPAEDQLRQRTEQQAGDQRQARYAADREPGDGIKAGSVLSQPQAQQQQSLDQNAAGMRPECVFHCSDTLSREEYDCYSIARLFRFVIIFWTSGA